MTASSREVEIRNSVDLQAPPNLTPLEEGTSANGSGSVAASWSALLAAGINDWGGVSPLTRDWVNPEKAWPHVSALAEVTTAAGFPLLPRYFPRRSVLARSLKRCIMTLDVVRDIIAASVETSRYRIALIFSLCS